MAEDIRSTGPVGLKGLKGINQQGNDELPTLEQLKSINRAYASGSVGPTPVDTSLQNYEGSMSQWGTSGYDDEIVNSPMSEGELQDARYENQPWYDTLANGIGKMLGTAGTTFVSSLVGLPYGLFQAANQGRWSALWDNDVTQGLADVDNWLEENMTNYRSQVQQNSPWYSPDNLLSMNFIADDVIKNAGFTLGAAASMAVGSGSLGLMSKALGFVNDVSKGTKIGTAALSSLFAATGEGMIEARQGVEERNKLETQRLNDALTPEYNALEMMQEEASQRYRATGDYETYKRDLQDIQAQKQNLDARKAAGLQQIQDSGQEMGNTILLANQALLTLGNLIQFGKGAVKSFDSARHAAEVSSKVAKPFGVRAVKAGADLVGSGYKIAGKNLGKTIAATKGILTEGSEEMNQQWIQSGAGAYYNREDVNDYWKAKMDPEAYKDTTEGLYTFGKALDRGFQESWGDVDQWEQFVIGGLTGMAGSYSPTKLFNQDKTKGRLDPRRYGSWEGGAYNEIRDFNRQYNQYEENINEVNRILQSEEFPERMRDMVGHTYTETEKTAAAEGDDKKAWKDADDKQFVHDVQSFLRAGKLDDLRAIYNEIGSQMSDEEVQNIVDKTTKKITAEEDKQNHDRMMDTRIAAAETDEEKAELQAEKDAYVGKAYYDGAYVDIDGNQTFSNDEIRNTVKHNSEELNRKLDSYLDSVEAVNKMTNGQLSRDQEDNLVYLHHLSKEKLERFDKIMADTRKKLPSKFLIKTSKTPEQLAQENASSDLAFSKDDNTPNGYVEVDTSLMNDKTFGNFFMNTVMYGNNIMPEKGEEDKDKKEEKAEKEREEQQRVNVERYRKNFYDTMRKGTNMTLEEIRDAFEDMRQDIYDASVLQNDSQEFWNTYMEYMMNPNKVDKAKEKEEKKVSEAQQKKELKDMSASDLAQRTDLKELLAQAKTDSDIGLINKIKKAMLIRQQKAKTSSAGRDANVLAGYADADKELAIQVKMAQLDKELDRMEDRDTEASLQELTDSIRGVDLQTVRDIVEANMNPVEKARMTMLAQTDPDAYEKEMAEWENRILQAVDRLEEYTLSDIPNFDESRVEPSNKDIQALSDKVKDENPEAPAEPKRHDNVNPVISVPVFASEAPIGTDSGNDSVSDPDALENDMQQGVTGVTLERSGQHPWRAVTRRVGYNTNEPYSQTLERLIANTEDEVKRAQLQKQLQRVRTVEKVLEEKGAFTRVEQGLVSRDTVVNFAVSKAVNDNSGDFVIFMTDAHGAILADLPSGDPDIEPNTNEIPGLADLYEEVRRQWDAFSEEEKSASEFIPVKGLQTKVDFTYFGKVMYQDERQSLNDLFKGEKFTLALKIKGAENSSSEPRITVVAGKRSLQGQIKEQFIRQPLAGTVGQPYVLIPTSKAGKKAFGEEYFAVPIATPSFGELSEDTLFYKVVKDILTKIKEGRIENKQAKELLQVLFGVDNVHVNFDGDLTKKGSGITITTFSRTDQSEKGNPHDIFKGNKENLDVDAALETLGRFFINISNKKMNTTEVFYTLPNGNKVYYNMMIGEIATTNAAMPHTVNDFFTVVPLEKKDGKFQQVAKKPVRMKFPKGSMDSVFHVRVQYKDGTMKMWSIDPSDNFICRDEQGRPIYKDDNVHTNSEKRLATQYRAEAFGRFYMKDFSKPFAVLLDGKTLLYNPLDRSFKTVQELEKTAPRYNKALNEYDRLQDMLESIDEARAEADEARAAAEAQKDEDKEKTIKRVEATITKLQNDGAKYVVCDVNGNPVPDGDYYKDEDGLLHARVTSMAEGDPKVEPFKETQDDGTTNPWILPSTTIGNQVDEFIRVFFEGGDPMKLKSPNLSQRSREKLLEELQKIKTSLDKSGWKVASRDIVASGVLSVKDANGDDIIVRIAGTLDLLLYNPEKDEYAIYDIKTHRKAIDFNNVENDSHMGKWSAQLSLYKELLEAKYPELRGKIRGLKILPIKIDSDSYDADRHTYSKNGDTLVDEKGDAVIAVFNYDGQTIPVRERTLEINMGKKGFKAAYNSEEGKKKIIFSKPRPKPGEAPKQKVKEGILKTINKIPAEIAISKCLKDDYKNNPEAIALCATLEEARKNGTLADLMLTEATMNMLSDMLNDKRINNYAARGRLGLEGLQIPGEKPEPKAGPMFGPQKSDAAADVQGGLNDELYPQVKDYLESSESHRYITAIQRQFRIGYNRSRRMLEAWKSQQNAGSKKLEDYTLDDFIIEARDKMPHIDWNFIKGKLLNIRTVTNDNAIKQVRDILSTYTNADFSVSASHDLFGYNWAEEVGKKMASISLQEAHNDMADNAEDKAKQRKILDGSTEKAWNRLTEENKKKAADTSNVIDVKRALQDAQKNPRKDPNQLISKYLHRKAVETSGYRKLDMQKELEWLNDVLPQLSRNNKIRIINGLIKCSDGTWDYGQLKNGLLYLGTNGKEGTVYHEAFHAITQWILTDDELDALYEAARERYGNLDTVTLEEKMADDFMLYTMGVKPSYKMKQQNIFRRLWDAIKKMFRKTSMIDKLYQDINDGVYAGKVLRNDNNEFAGVSSEDREASMGYAFLDSEQRERLRDNDVSRDQYEVLDSQEKRYLFHCVI